MMTMCSSAFVLIEPAPYEVLICCCITYALFSKQHSFYPMHFWPTLLLILFLLLNMISMLFAKQTGASISYLFITGYLVLSWMGISGISGCHQTKLFPYIFNGYVLAAVLSVLCSFVSYQFGIVEDLLQQFGRMKGFFKDPNVFGPYLIPPAVYTLWMLDRRGFRRMKSWLYLSFFFLLSIGILFSFSRAAWGNYALTLLCYFLFLKTKIRNKWKIIIVLGIITIPLLFYLLIATNSTHLLMERVGMQHYDNERFSNQEAAAHYVAKFPLGTGPGQSEYELDISTHSLFIRILYENGLASLLVFICFYLLCLKQSIITMFYADEKIQGYFVIITACLIGILFNSFFIDTIHWRHVWLLFALPFVPVQRKKLTYE